MLKMFTWIWSIFLYACNYEFGNIFDHIDESYFGSPVWSYLLKVVMEGVYSEIDNILAEKVKPRVFRRIRILHNNFEF